MHLVSIPLESLFTGDSYESIRPLVLTQRQSVDHEAVRFVFEAWLLARSFDAAFGIGFCGVDAQELRVVTGLFVPAQFAVLTEVFRWGSV